MCIFALCKLLLIVYIYIYIIYRVSQNSVDFSLKRLLCKNKARWVKYKAIFGFFRAFYIYWH